MERLFCFYRTNELLVTEVTSRTGCLVSFSGWLDLWSGGDLSVQCLQMRWEVIGNNLIIIAHNIYSSPHSTNNPSLSGQWRYVPLHSIMIISTTIFMKLVVGTCLLFKFELKCKSDWKIKRLLNRHPGGHIGHWWGQRGSIREESRLNSMFGVLISAKKPLWQRKKEQPSILTEESLRAKQELAPITELTRCSCLY